MPGYVGWVARIRRWYGDNRWAKALCVGALLVGLIVALEPIVLSSSEASTTTVDLGQASSYAVLSGASVGNTVNAIGAPYTTLRGDLGVNADTQPTGFPPGVVTGTIRVGATVGAAYTDLIAAYNDISDRTGGTALAGDLAGMTLAPGLYSAAGALSDTGTATLNGGGDPNAVFVFQVGGALNLAAGAHVTLTNGAQASNVFWQVNGAAAIGANATFAGTIMALDAIAVGAGSEVDGRALALNGAISLNSNEFYSAPPTLTLTGGATAITNNSTPTITGTTDLEAPGVVTVAIAGQTLTATPTNGAWSVASALLVDGTYPVVASAIDGAGNQTNANEQLTIDTVAPLVTITGGASVTTSDVDPTITGTSNAAPGTTLTVTVEGQTITTLLQANDTWNVTPTALPDGSYQVLASVTDRAGNVGSASQTLAILADAVPSTGSTGGSTSGGGGGGGPTVASPTLMLWLPVTSVTAISGNPVHVPFVLSGPAATVTLTVLRRGRVVARVSIRSHNGGSGWLTWNGKIKHKLAPTAAYTIVVRAVSPAGAATHDRAKLHINQQIRGA